MKHFRFKSINSLQDRIRDLETTLENSKYSLSGTLKASEATKIIQQDEYTLKSEQSPNLLGNDNKINPNIQQVEEFRNEISESVSEVSKRPLKQSLKTEQYNLSSNQDKGLNGANFITLGNLSEQEKIEIIQTGFRLNQERKISLKNYYEGTEEYSLFQHKGYNIKYESIRRTKLYQSLKG